MAKRLNGAELAREWGVSRNRVFEMRRDGRLTRGEDGKYDLDEANRVRALALEKHGHKMLLVQNANRYGTTPAKAAALAQNLTDEEADFLGLDPPSPPPSAAPVVGQTKDLANAALAQTALIGQLRAQKMQIELNRAQQKADIEAGLYVLKTDVRRSGNDAGKIIAALLATLPTEIAALFDDPKMKDEVYARVSDRCDQMQHAMHRALSAATPDENT